MTESHIARVLRTLNTPVRRQRRELEERRELEREGRQIRSRGPMGDVAQARLARIAERIADLTPRPEPSRKQRQAYRRRLAEEAIELRRRADRGEHDGEWVRLLARESLAERRAQLAERRRQS
ncbi:hypothetical protein [Thioalkalivibrio paradoxus]|uniref:Uncharacterized protein n=1 Tax=Thioalkalivibrio paradoxus ARh 1 TaxID=713585 RepID=W0DSN7_9GAMM|nr:hypothetical protein [Thioalkalivibrio paradoxus]AHF00268.1 hypothetical protein THITH_15090 [Thioalkalivibrio paradoxus ARh 1]